MRNYIILNGTNSNTINGLLIQSLAPISKPLMRTEIEEIDGRDGDIITPLGFSAYDKQITVGLYGDFDINAIIAFFNSEGTVTFSNEPDKYYNYQIYDQIDFERLVRYRTATVTFHVQPFKYGTTGETQTLDAGDPVTGEGSSIVLDGTGEALFKKLEPKGDAYQQTYSGKNLLNTNALNRTLPYTTTSRGITFKLEADGSITLNGTNDGTGNSVLWLYQNPITMALNAGSYTGDLNPSNGVYQAVDLVAYDGVKYWGFRQNATNPMGQSNWQFYIQVGNGTTTTFSNYKIYPMLEAGTTKSPYEPYTGGSPMPNPDFPSPINVVSGAQTVRITGKNLCSSAVVASSTAVNFTCACKSVSGTDLTLSAEFGVDTTGGQLWAFVDGVDLHTRVGTIDTSASGTSVAVANLSAITQQIQQGSSLTIRVNKSGAGFSTISKAQLENGSTATSYEPYQSQSQIINLGGTNLFDVNDIEGGQTQNITVDSDGWLTCTIDNTSGAGSKYGLWLTNNLQALKTSTTYAIVMEVKNVSGTGVVYPTQGSGAQSQFTSNVSYNFSGISAGQTYIFTQATKSSFAGTNQGLRTVVAFSAGQSGSITFRLSVVEDTSITPTKFKYVPYTTYAYELAKIPNTNYEDKPVKVDGTWYIRRMVGKVVLTGGGSETWYIYGNNMACWINKNDAIRAASTTAIAPIVSDYYTATSETNTYTGSVPYGASLVSGSGRIVLRNKDITSVADMRTWLSTHNTTVYYALAEPVDEEITDTTLIEQLEALQEAHSYKGRTHINAIATGDNLPHIIEVEANGDASGTVTNAGNIYSKPKLTVYGSGNIGIYLNGVQMFQVALGSDGYITIDTNLMEAYKDNLQTLMNRQVIGDYDNFKLPVGESTISFSGTVTKCIVENYSRWL